MERKLRHILYNYAHVRIRYEDAEKALEEAKANVANAKTDYEKTARHLGKNSGHFPNRDYNLIEINGVIYNIKISQTNEHELDPMTIHEEPQV